MHNSQDTTKEIRRLEVNFLNVKREIKTLKNRVRAYKGWTTRYRRLQKELKQDNLAIVQQRDQAIQDLHELQTRQQNLLKTVEEAKQAVESRDQALLKLDEVIDKIEQYREICIKANKIAYADKLYLIKEAEKLFFDEEILNSDIEFDPIDQPHMLTDQASINRSLANGN
ncbi:MAG: hypothetical protein AAGE84_08295 [Cyanobacteria bacterium P01_G01_bin.39]